MVPRTTGDATHTCFPFSNFVSAKGLQQALLKTLTFPAHSEASLDGCPVEQGSLFQGEKGCNFIRSGMQKRPSFCLHHSHHCVTREKVAASQHFVYAFVGFSGAQLDGGQRHLDFEDAARAARQDSRSFTPALASTQIEVSCRSHRRLGAGIERVGFVDIMRVLVSCWPKIGWCHVVCAKASIGACAPHVVGYRIGDEVD